MLRTNFGPYQLNERVATGGMGELFFATLVREGGFEKPVALKRILPHLAQNPAFIEMFLREARISAALQHPQIVNVFDFGNIEGVYYLAMEFVNGCDLNTILSHLRAEGGRLPVAAAALIALDVARALAYAHHLKADDGASKQLIHRDVSPANILIARTGEIKLTDFGLAKDLADEMHSQSGMLKGKYCYISPEQITGAEVSPATDVYSLGVVLYEMLAMRPPFPLDKGVGPLFDAVRAGQCQPLREAAPDAPEALVAVAAKAMHTAVPARYADGLEIQAALEQATAGLALAQARSQLGELAAKYGRRPATPSGSALEGTQVSDNPIARKLASTPQVGLGNPASGTGAPASQPAPVPSPLPSATPGGTPFAIQEPERPHANRLSGRLFATLAAAAGGAAAITFIYMGVAAFETYKAQEEKFAEAAANIKEMPPLVRLPVAATPAAAAQPKPAPVMPAPAPQPPKPAKPAAAPSVKPATNGTATALAAAVPAAAATPAGNGAAPGDGPPAAAPAAFQCAVLGHAGVQTMTYNGKAAAPGWPGFTLGPDKNFLSLAGSDGIFHGILRLEPPAAPGKSFVASISAKGYYANVIMDGVALGETPMGNVKITPGTHTLILRNDGAKAEITAKLRCE